MKAKALQYQQAALDPPANIASTKHRAINALPDRVYAEDLRGPAGSAT